MEQKAHHAMDPADTSVRCTKCGDAMRVSFAESMAHGWPVCCGETMRLVLTGGQTCAPPSMKHGDSGVFRAVR